MINALRTFAIWSLLAVGLVLTFAGMLAAVGAAYLFLGGIAAMVCFVGIAGTVLAGMSALFAGQEPPEEYDADFDQWTAHEGATVVPFQGRVR